MSTKLSRSFPIAAKTGIASLLVALSLGAAQAQIADAGSCDTAVANAEKSIIKAQVSADDLNTLVSLADQAKAACGSSDWDKATKLTAAIDEKIKAASGQ